MRPRKSEVPRPVPDTVRIMLLEQQLMLTQRWLDRVEDGETPMLFEQRGERVHLRVEVQAPWRPLGGLVRVYLWPEGELPSALEATASLPVVMDYYDFGLMVLGMRASLASGRGDVDMLRETVPHVDRLHEHIKLWVEQLDVPALMLASDKARAKRMFGRKGWQPS